MASRNHNYILQSRMVLMFGLLILFFVTNAGSERNIKRNRYQSTTTSPYPVVTFAPRSRSKSTTSSSVTRSRNAGPHRISRTTTEYGLIAPRTTKTNSLVDGKDERIPSSVNYKATGTYSNTTNKPIMTVSTNRRKIFTNPSVVVTEEPLPKYKAKVSTTTISSEPEAILQNANATQNFANRTRHTLPLVVPSTTIIASANVGKDSNNIAGLRKTTTAIPTVGYPKTTKVSTMGYAVKTTSANMAVSQSRHTYTGTRITKPWDGPEDEMCREPCDMRHCDAVSADSCQGNVKRDKCGCCPVCDDEVDFSLGESSSSQTALVNTGNACKNMTCPRNKVCILNIQGLPMCRCRNVYMCKGHEKKAICSTDGTTFKNHCFLKIEECIQNRRLRIAHKGSCRMNSGDVPPLRIPYMTTTGKPTTDVPDYTDPVHGRKKIKTHTRRTTTGKEGMFVREKRKWRNHANV